jgi:hypothetical protein
MDARPAALIQRAVPAFDSGGYFIAICSKDEGLGLEARVLVSSTKH